MTAGMEWNMKGILTPPFNISTIIYYFKKLRISHYMYITVHKILKLRQLFWACESTSTNFQDYVTIILENPKIRVFPKILRKVKDFKICDLQTY